MMSVEAQDARKKSRQKALLLATVIVSICYLGWRLLFTLPWNHTVFSIFCGVSLFVAEAMSIVEMMAHFLNMKNVKIPEMPIIPDDMFPHVDILIVTHNEEVELLYKTLNGCNYLKYPDKSKVHVYLCDDNNRPQMRELAEKMGVGYFGVENNKTAKAGNLNYALERITSPYVAVFDSDMIPTSDFLLEIIPYFFMPDMIKDGNGWRMRTPEEMDPKEQRIGYVQTRQSFYNLDILQRNLYLEKNAPNELDYFYRAVNVGRMATGGAAFAGSNVIFSRKALDDAGGFTWSITEDLATSIEILALGYRALSLDKELAHGMSPEDAWGFIKQRQRWSRGAAHDIVSLNFIRSKLPWRAKLSFIIGYLYWWTFVRRFIYIICPILWGCFGVVVADITLTEALIFWLPYYLFYNISLKRMSDGTQSAVWSCIVDTVQFPYLMWPIIAGSMKIPQNKFIVSPKIKQTGRNSSLELAIPHIILSALSIVAIVVCFCQVFIYKYEGAVITLFWLFYNLYALANSIVYYYGRYNNRYYERVPASVPVAMKSHGLTVHGMTSDLSEGGMAVLIDLPDYFPYARPFDVTVKHKEYTASCKASVRHVQQQPDGRWMYSLIILDMGDHDMREYLQILYDRDHMLPRLVNLDFVTDVKLVTKGMAANPQRGERRLPRIILDLDAESLEAGTVKILNFNYKFIMVQRKEVMPDKLTMRVFGNVEFTCVAAPDANQERGGLDPLYEIENWEQVATDSRLRHGLMNYLGRKQEAREAQAETMEAEAALCLDMPDAIARSTLLASSSKSRRMQQPWS